MDLCDKGRENVAVIWLTDIREKDSKGNQLVHAFYCDNPLRNCNSLSSGITTPDLICLNKSLAETLANDMT